MSSDFNCMYIFSPAGNMNYSNLSELLGTNDSCGIYQPSIITKTSLVIAYIILVFMASLENAFVIYLVRTTSELKQATFNYLIINMAVADFLDVVCSSALTISFMFVRWQWIPGLAGEISCRLVYFLLLTSVGISISTLVIMSVDRYLVIVHSTRMTPSITRRCIAVSWIISAIAGSSYLYKMDLIKDKDIHVCIPVWSSNPEQSIFYYKVEQVVMFALYYALPLLVIGLANALTGHTLRQRRPIGSSHTQARIDRQNQKIYMLLVTVVLFFAICWMFAHVNHLMSAFQIELYCKLPASIPLYFFWVSHANSAINPIIYFVFNRKFRQGLRKSLRGRVNGDRTTNDLSQGNHGFENIELESRSTQFVTLKHTLN